MFLSQEPILSTVMPYRHRGRVYKVKVVKAYTGFVIWVVEVPIIHSIISPKLKKTMKHKNVNNNNNNKAKHAFDENGEMAQW